jgi:hypothetical protein
MMLANLSHGPLLKSATLEIVTSDHVVHCQEIHLWVDRPTVKQGHRKTNTGPGLYGGTQSGAKSPGTVPTLNLGSSRSSDFADHPVARQHSEKRES